jgi:hypothetical protein
MTHYRPTGVLVIALLCLVAGAYGTCCGVLNVGEPLLRPVVEDALYALTQEDEPEPSSFETWVDVALYARAVLDLALSVALIVAGVGLLRMRRWARPLALVCAALLVLSSLVAGAEGVYHVLSGAEEIESEGLSLPGLPVLAKSLVAGVIFGSLLWIGFGIATLVVLLRPSVAAAFRGGAQAGQPETSRP